MALEHAKKHKNMFSLRNVAAIQNEIRKVVENWKIPIELAIENYKKNYSKKKYNLNAIKYKSAAISKAFGIAKYAWVLRMLVIKN